ncbi:MAG: hypothetical protein K2G53_03125 [Muribaculaceae bacterium]|nr:hypothetical protein [Muribaculaceae bacterium]
MKENEINARLMNLTALCAKYCAAVENCQESEQEEFVKEMLDLSLRHL